MAFYWDCTAQLNPGLLFNSQHLCCLFRLQRVNSFKQESTHQVSYISWPHAVVPVPLTTFCEALASQPSSPSRGAPFAISACRVDARKYCDLLCKCGPRSCKQMCIWRQECVQKKCSLPRVWTQAIFIDLSFLVIMASGLCLHCSHSLILCP